MCPTHARNLPRKRVRYPSPQPRSRVVVGNSSGYVVDSEGMSARVSPCRFRSLLFLVAFLTGLRLGAVSYNEEGGVVRYLFHAAIPIR
jgi:hypothetical protein